MRILRSFKRNGIWSSQFETIDPGHLHAFETDPWKLFERLDGVQASNSYRISERKKELNTFVIVNNFRYKQDFI